MLDSNWKIAALVGALILFRVVAGSWRTSPHRTFLLELANSALVAFALVFLLIRPFLLQAFFIPSGSMEPTLHGPDAALKRQGDRILVNRFIYRLGPPRRGDIVVFKAPPQALAAQAKGGGAAAGPVDGAQDWIKRVVGLPGDRVEVIAGLGVRVNGKLLSERYTEEIPDRNFPADSFGALTGAYVVPPDSVFVMGDNRNNSTDSRLWVNGETDASQPELPMRNILGRALIIFWPPNRIGTLTR